MSADLTDAICHYEAAARAHFEVQRWPHGPVCPHCGVVGNATRLAGGAHRPGLLECRACGCGARIGHVDAVAPTPPGFIQCGHGSGVQAPACG